jgi:hypothetical protein
MQRFERRASGLYSLDVETLFDSDGDRAGDFEGLSRRLDYLAATRTLGRARLDRSL